MHDSRVKKIKLVMMKKINHTNDTLSDALTRIRNAIRSGKHLVSLPSTKLVLEVLKVMYNHGYLGDYYIDGDGAVVVNLVTNEGYRFTNLVRISKPGIRKYVGVSRIRPVKGGKGLAIISTSKGVMSGDMAKKQNIGGEYLCEIW